MSQTIDTPSYTIELSDGSIRPMTVKELAIRLAGRMAMRFSCGVHARL